MAVPVGSSSWSPVRMDAEPWEMMLGGGWAWGPCMGGSCSCPTAKDAVMGSNCPGLGRPWVAPMNGLPLCHQSPCCWHQPWFPRQGSKQLPLPLPWSQAVSGPTLATGDQCWAAKNSQLYGQWSRPTVRQHKLERKNHLLLLGK